MDAFTITEMHYLVVSLFCDLVWPLYLFILEDLGTVAALRRTKSLFAICFVL